MRKRFPCGGCRDGWSRRTVGRIIGCAGTPATSNLCRRWPAVCRVLQLCLYAICESFSRIHQACHRADVWRYLHMYRRGGVYLDFKCGLLQPLWSWLLELQNACTQHELGRQTKARAGEVRAGAQCPPFSLIVCSPRHPLLARVLGEAMMTPQTKVGRRIAQMQVLRLSEAGRVSNLVCCK